MSNIIILKENQKAKIEVERSDGVLTIWVNDTQINTEDKEAVIVVSGEIKDNRDLLKKVSELSN